MTQGVGGQDWAQKPIDLGNGRLAGSFGLMEPSLLSIGRVHSAIGYVELTAAPTFAEQDRGDPSLTRRYRASLAEDAPACCWLEGPGGERAQDVVVDLGDPARPAWAGMLGANPFHAWASAADDGTLELGWRLASGSEGRQPTVHVRGRLGAPALAEITETDPPPPDPGATTRDARGQMLVLARPDLGAQVRIEVQGWEWRLQDDAAVAVPASSEKPSDDIDLLVRLELEVPHADRQAATAATAGKADGDRALSDPLVSGALAYVRGCTALSVAPGERVLLTDHRLLPLSWTRDAYYQALVLLAAGMPADVEIVADHLRWLWRRCDRPDGSWARSHHASGRRKDLGFQADQQLYPILEACDYWRLTGCLPDGVRWTDAIGGAWRRTQAALDPLTGLLSTVENAADDPAAAPFVASSQILMWYAAHRLAQVAQAGAVDLDAAGLRRAADRTRAAFGESYGEAVPWPYAVDGRGRRVMYHDANDMPLALAPIWGFCAPSDPGWQATIAFAWSPDNPGWFAGERAGLGSVHTPLPWTLGDVQDWIIGRTAGDTARCERAIQRLKEVAFVDGTLPEAYSADRHPDIRVRHWFAWPGAVMAALRILDRRGVLEGRLAGR